MTRLVPRPGVAWSVIACCAVVVGAMGFAFHDHDHGSGFDTAVDGWIQRTFAQRLLAALLHLTDPPLVVGLFVALVVVAALLRRWDVAVFAIVTPGLALAVTELILKPVVHRTNYLVTEGLHVQSLAYPSGHETGVGSLLAVLGVLAAAAPVSRRAKAITFAVLGLLLLVAAVALVGRFYHYATDTIGAAGVVTACALAVGMLVDRGALLVRRYREQLADPVSSPVR